MKIEDGPAAVIGKILLTEPLTSGIFYTYTRREGEEETKLRESEDLPDTLRNGR